MSCDITISDRTWITRQRSLAFALMSLSMSPNHSSKWFIKVCPRSTNSLVPTLFWNLDRLSSLARRSCLVRRETSPRETSPHCREKHSSTRNSDSAIPGPRYAPNNNIGLGWNHCYLALIIGFWSWQCCPT